MGTYKENKKKHWHAFRLDDDQQERFDQMFRASGSRNKTAFILGRIFG